MKVNRIKKAGMNSVINAGNYLLMILPNFIVRKVFIESLGIQMLGLNSLYINIAGLLTVTELGVSYAISYALYKPVANDDKVKIKGFIDYYTKIYRGVSLVILLVGLSIIPFLPIITKSNIKHMQIYFILYVLDTCITYLFSAKFCLFGVTQQQYIFSTVYTLSTLSIAVLQIIMMKYAPNYMAYLIIKVSFTVIQMIILTIIVRRLFPWLRNTRGVITKEDKNGLFKNIKAMFFHKFGALVLMTTDNIVISAFINLTIVGIFNNYFLVISGMQTLMVRFFDGIAASIGDLLTENNSEKSYKTFKKLFFLAFIIVSTIAIILLNSINQFVEIWLGKGYEIGGVTILFLVMNFYFLGMKLSVEKFKETSGLYHEDRYMALIQALINLVLSIILVKIIGLPGVFIATFISNYTLEFWIKPKIVYRDIFKRGVSDYLYRYFSYFGIFIIVFAINKFAFSSIANINTIPMFLLNCVLNGALTLGIYFVIFRKREEFIFLKTMIISLAKKLKR